MNRSPPNLDCACFSSCSTNTWYPKRWNTKKVLEKVYFKSQILVHEYWTILDHFLRSSIVSFWITPARSKERKYHNFRQYWYTRNVPVFTNTGTFQYLGPEVYFFQSFLWRHRFCSLCSVSNRQVFFRGGGNSTFFQVGVCGSDFRSVGLANWYLPLKRGGLWTENFQIKGLWAKNSQIWGLVS